MCLPVGGKQSLHLILFQTLPLSFHSQLPIEKLKSLAQWPECPLKFPVDEGSVGSDTNKDTTSPETGSACSVLPGGICFLWTSL